MSTPAINRLFRDASRGESLSKLACALRVPCDGGYPWAFLYRSGIDIANVINVVQKANRDADNFVQNFPVFNPFTGCLRFMINAIAAADQADPRQLQQGPVQIQSRQEEMAFRNRYVNLFNS